jgi:hypothetical protein
MKRQSAAPPKKRGPPATGKGEPILVRLQPAQLAALDAWIARQDAQFSRPEPFVVFSSRRSQYRSQPSREPKKRPN